MGRRHRYLHGVWERWAALRELVDEERRTIAKRTELRARFPYAVISPTAIIRETPSASIKLAPGVVVSDWCLLLAIDDPNGQPGVSELEVGEGSYFGEGCNIRAAGGTIAIGRKVQVAQGTHIIASNHSMALGVPIIDQPWDSTRTGVTVADDVWIGCNAVLLPGAHVGEGAVVAASAVVVGKVPPYAIFGGVPARQISTRN